MSSQWQDHEKWVNNTYSQEQSPSAESQKTIQQVIDGLNSGNLRVCKRQDDGKWITHQWIKKAILLYFRQQSKQVTDMGPFAFVDKIPVRKWTGDEGVRVVPPAFVRYGACVRPGAILMPSYVNIGAYVGEGTMIDTWATVGSCAQVGANVHISGGVGIGGVLEPIQANPVIIEDNAFIGSRCIIVEGVVIEQGAVLGAGVTLTASSKIIDVTTDDARQSKGRVPRNAVVIPGITQRDFAAGSFGVPCALIIGYRKESTDLKTALTQALRDYQVSV